MSSASPVINNPRNAEAKGNINRINNIILSRLLNKTCIFGIIGMVMYHWYGNVLLKSNEGFFDNGLFKRFLLLYKNRI